MDKIPAGKCQSGTQYLSPRGQPVTCVGPTQIGDTEEMAFRDARGGAFTLPLMALVETLPAALPPQDDAPDQVPARELKGADRAVIEPRIPHMTEDELADLGTRDGRMWVQGLIATELQRRGFEQVQRDGMAHAFKGDLSTCNDCGKGRADPAHAVALSVDDGPTAALAAMQAETALLDAEQLSNPSIVASYVAPDGPGTINDGETILTDAMAQDDADGDGVDGPQVAASAITTDRNLSPGELDAEAMRDMMAALVDATAAGPRVDQVKDCSLIWLLEQLQTAQTAVTPALQATVMREIDRQIKALQKVEGGSAKDWRGWLDSKHVQARPGVLRRCRQLLGETNQLTPPADTDTEPPVTKPDENLTDEEVQQYEQAHEVAQALLPGLDVRFWSERRHGWAAAVWGNDGRAMEGSPTGTGATPVRAVHDLLDQRRLAGLLDPTALDATPSTPGAGMPNEVAGCEGVQDEPIDTDGVRVAVAPPDDQPYTKAQLDAMWAGDDADIEALKTKLNEQTKDLLRTVNARLAAARKAVHDVETDLHPLDLLAAVTRCLAWYQDHGIEVTISTRRAP